MNIFLAGATGAVGKSLVPMLVQRGHRVVATTTSQAKVPQLRAAGAEPVVLDALNRDAVMRAVDAARPEVVVHQMTALASLKNLKRFDKAFELTNRLRTEGAQYLLAASAAAGARRFIVQSYTGWPNIREGGRVKTEDDPLDPHPPRILKNVLDAIMQLEAMVLGAAGSGIDGLALRYGSFYGPGTSIYSGGDVVKMVRRRMFPIVGSGAGVWSFIHIDDAAEATRIAIEGGPAGIYNIVDDEPAEVSIWLPELVREVGAKPPFHVPVWLGRLAIGDLGVLLMTEIRGASNAKARRLLGWQPAYPSWRDGFRAFPQS